MSRKVHRAVPLHPSFLCAMLPWEIFKMALDNRPVAVQFHEQAKKRLIATHPNSKFFLTHSKQKTRQFLTATRSPFLPPDNSPCPVTLSPPQREGRGPKETSAPAISCSLQQAVCELRSSETSADALRAKQRAARRAFTPPAARRMLARGSSSRNTRKEAIQANSGGSPCGFS